MNGNLLAIFTAPYAGADMLSFDIAEVIAGMGIRGDRYAHAKGSFNENKIGSRQVSLINANAFPNTGFEYKDCRRNLIVEGVELNWLSEGREFQIGQVTFRGVKYCDPCNRPSKLSGNEKSFQEAFLDRGGILAEVLTSGIIKVGDLVIPPPKGY